MLAFGAGAFLAQAIGIFSAPLTSRLFAPEAFGLAALFGSLVSLAGLVTTLQYQVAIMLPERDEHAANVFGLCCFLVMTFSLVALVLTVCCGRQILHAIHASALVPHMWLFPIAVFLTGIVLPLSYWSSRHKRFRQLGAIHAASSICQTGALLGAGITGYTSGGNMIVAKLLGPVIRIGTLAYYVFRHDLSFIVEHCTLGGIWRVARRYVKFPLLSSWSAVINASSQQAPVVLLAAFFGTTVVGLYSRAAVLLALPLSIVAQAISQVFFQRAASKRAAGEDLGDLVEGVCRPLMGIMIPPLLIVALIGKDIFSVFLGARWAEAGTYAQILVPWILFFSLTASVTSLFDVLERQGNELLFNIVLLSSRAGALVIGGVIIKDIRFTLLVFSIVSALGYALRTIYILSAAGASPWRLLFSILLYLAYATPIFLLIAVGKWYLSLASQWLVIVALGASVPYYVCLWWRDDQLRQILRRLAAKLFGR